MPLSIRSISSWLITRLEEAASGAGWGAGAGCGAGAGAACGAGADFGAEALSSEGITPKFISKPASSSRARSTDMTLTNSLLSMFSMLSMKRTTTSVSSSLPKCSFLNRSISFSSKDWGVEMFTGYPRKSDRAVEAAPII